MYKHNSLLKEKTSAKQEPLNEAVAKKKLNERNVMADALIQDFARNEMGTEKLAELAQKDVSHARNVAILMANQKQLLESTYGANFKEDTQTSSDFKLTPTNVIKVVRLGSANSNRGKIFKEVALVTMRDIMIFTQPEYAKSVRGAEAGQRLLENIKPNYASSFQEYSFPIPAPASSFSTLNLSPAPIVKLRVSVVYNGIEVGRDDGQGGFNSINSIFTSAGSSIDYTSGATTLVFSSNLATSDTLKIEWIWDSEFEGTFDDYGVLHIQTRVLTFNPVLHPLGYQYSTLAAATLGSTGFGNYQELIVKSIADAHSARKDHKAIALARKLALGSAKFTFDADWAGQGSDNDFNHVQRITETIGNIGTTIYNELQRGGITTLVAGTKAVNYLAKHRKYERDLSQRRGMGTYLDGYLDKVPVYVCPNVTGLLDTKEVLAVYKNPDEDGEPSIVFGTYTELTAGLEYPEFYTRGNMATVEDYQVIQAKFLRILSIENIVG
jgi:hypothetical protein